MAGRPTLSITFLRRLSARGRRAAEQNGFSLVTVAALGSVVMLWLFAITESVTPMYKKAAETRHAAVLRSAAEAGLDYVLSKLSASVGAEEPSSFDDSERGAPYTTTTLPANLVGNGGVVVRVTVANEVPPQRSYLYDSQLDPDSTDNVVGGVNYYRYVTAEAEYAGMIKRIAVTLTPVFPGPPTEPGPTSAPYFQWAAMGRNLLEMAGSGYTDAYNSKVGDYPDSLEDIGGDIASNTSIMMREGATVGGSLFVHSLPFGSTTTEVAHTGDMDDGTPWTGQVKNEVKVNAMSDGGYVFQTPGAPPAPGDNVLGGPWVDKPPNYTPIFPSLSQPKIFVPAPPSAPPEAHSVGSLGVSSTGHINIVDGATTPNSLVVSSGTLDIPPGDYIIDSFSMSNNSSITVGDVSTPTRFFVQGETSQTNAIQMSSNSQITNTIPARLQVWYNGSKPVVLQGNSKFKAVMFAPASAISVMDNASVFGSVLGNSVLLSGPTVAVHYDKLLNDTDAMKDWGLFYSLAPSTVYGPAQEVVGLQTVSWHEY